MWPIPALQNDSVTVSFFSDTVVCSSWIHKKKNNAQVYLQAYQRISFQCGELENSILFNPTHVKNLITTFLSHHNKQNAFVSFSVHGMSVREEYITVATSTPKREDFGIPYSSNVLWNYHYLYQNDNGQSVFYLYRIPQFLLLQYKLLAISMRCNLVSMTTKSHALFDCYKHLCGTTFRQSTFAIDMLNNNNNVEHIISKELLQKTIHIPEYIRVNDELPYLAISYGLFANQGS